MAFVDGVIEISKVYRDASEMVFTEINESFIREMQLMKRWQRSGSDDILYRIIGLTAFYVNYSNS